MPCRVYARLISQLNFISALFIYRVRQGIGRFLSVKKIKNIGYYDTATFIRKYITTKKNNTTFHSLYPQDALHDAAHTQQADREH